MRLGALLTRRCAWWTRQCATTKRFRGDDTPFTEGRAAPHGGFDFPARRFRSPRTEVFGLVLGAFTLPQQSPHVPHPRNVGIVVHPPPLKQGRSVGHAFCGHLALRCVYFHFQDNLQNPPLSRGYFWYNMHQPRGCSSTGQSDGFLNRRFRVRFPAAPPKHFSPAFRRGCSVFRGTPRP